MIGGAPVADIKGKSRAKPGWKASSTGTKGNGKEEEYQKQSKKAPPRRERSTRSATFFKPEAVAVEEEPIQEAEDEIMTDTIPTPGDEDDDNDADGKYPTNTSSADSSPIPKSLPSHRGTRIDPWIKAGMSIA